MCACVRLPLAPLLAYAEHNYTRTTICLFSSVNGEHTMFGDWAHHPHLRPLLVVVRVIRCAWRLTLSPSCPTCSAQTPHTTSRTYQGHGPPWSQLPTPLNILYCMFHSHKQNLKCLQNMSNIPWLPNLALYLLNLLEITFFWDQANNSQYWYIKLIIVKTATDNWTI